MLNTHFNKEKLVITCKESGGNVDYSYKFFKEGFEEWARSVDLDLADTDHLERYLTECGYNVVEITELKGDSKMLREKMINNLKKDNTIEQLQEVGKINIDFIDEDLGLLIEVLEEEFYIKTEIQNLIGGRYLVNLNYQGE